MRLALLSIVATRSWVTAVRIALVLASVGGLVTAVSGVAAGQAPAPRAKPDTRLIEATRALSAGDLARAFELGTAYLAAHPGEPAARVLLARVHLDRDELDAAYQQLDRAARASHATSTRSTTSGSSTGQLAARAVRGAGREGAGVGARTPAARRVARGAGAADRGRARIRGGARDQARSARGAARPRASCKRIRLDCDGAIALYTQAEAVRPTFDGAFGLGSCLLRQSRRRGAAAVRAGGAARRPRRRCARRAGLGAARPRTAPPTRSSASSARSRSSRRWARRWYCSGAHYQTSGDRARSQAAFASAEQLRSRPRVAGAALTCGAPKPVARSRPVPSCCPCVGRRSRSRRRVTRVAPSGVRQRRPPACASSTSPSAPASPASPTSPAAPQGLHRRNHRDRASRSGTSTATGCLDIYLVNGSTLDRQRRGEAGAARGAVSQQPATARFVT